jgi:hypothetical protein
MAATNHNYYKSRPLKVRHNLKANVRICRGADALSGSESALASPADLKKLLYRTAKGHLGQGIRLGI